MHHVFGKDEVTTSNLLSSSKKACDRNDYRLFCFVRSRKQRQVAPAAVSLYMGIEENGAESTKDPITYNMSAVGHSGTPL